MTFITVVKNSTFDAGTVEVDFTGTFTGNLTGNVLDALLVEANTICVNTDLRTDFIREKNSGNGIIMVDPVEITQSLKVDTITDTDGVSGVDVESVTILNGVLTADTVETDDIFAKTSPGSGNITIKDNVNMFCKNIANVNVITANVFQAKSGAMEFLSNICIPVGNKLQTDLIESKTLNGTVTFNDDVTLQTGEILTADTANIDTIHARTTSGAITVSDDLCIDAANVLQVDTVQSKSNGPIALNDDVTVATGNALTSDTVNVDTLNARTTSGAITVSDDLCIAAANALIVDTIRTKSNGPLSFTDDLCITAGNVLQVDTIQEKTGTNGVRIDGVLLKDSDVIATEVFTDTISANTTNGAISVNDDLCIDAANVLQVDVIQEKTEALGVTIDGVLLKDNDVEADETRTDTISAKTTSGAITVSDDLCIDAANALVVDTIRTKSNGPLLFTDDLCITAGNVLQVDTIQEKTGANGVTVDGVILKDSDVEADEGRFGRINSNVTDGTITIGDDVVISSDETLTVSTVDGGGSTITIKDDVDMFCQNLSNIGTFSANIISAKPNTTSITFSDDVDLFCQNLSNVATLSIDTMNAKPGSTQITVGEDLVPDTTQTYDLGTSAFEWNKMFVQDIDASGDVTIAGDLTVSGNTTTISTTDLIVEDNKIVINSPPQAIDSDAGFCIARYQNEGDTGTSTGDVVQDTPFETGNAIAVGTTTILTISNTVSGDDDYYNKWFVRITDGPNAGDVREVSDFDSASGNITVSSPFSSAITTDDVYALFPCKNIFIHWDESANKIVFSCIANVDANIQANVTPIVDASGNRLDLMPLCTGNIDAWHVSPLQDSTYDLGTSAKRWRNIYTDDITITDSIVAPNICATTAVQTNAIEPKSGNEISVTGNLTLDSADYVNTDQIASSTTGTIRIIDDVTLQAGETFTADTVVTDTINSRANGPISVGDDVCITAGNVLQVDEIQSKSNGPITFQDDVTIGGGNSLVIAELAGSGSVPISVDNTGKVIFGNVQTTTSNIVCAQTRIETPLIQSKDASALNVGSDLDMQDNNIANVTTFSVDTIESNDNIAISVTDDLCIADGNVIQVNAITEKTTDNGVAFSSNVCVDASKFLQTDNIEAKGTLITVHDPILMNSGADQIRFTDGIEIGDSGTDTNGGANSIAIGKDAVVGVGGTAGIAVGHFANVAVGTYSIAIGGGASAGAAADSTGYDSIAVGRNTTASANCTVAIGLDTTATAANVVAIGCGATSATIDSIVLGSDSPTNSSATAEAWGQIFQNKMWADTTTKIASINATGDIIKGGAVTFDANLDMGCFSITNVDLIEANVIVSKGLDEGTLTDVVAFRSPAIVDFATSGGGERNQFWGYGSGTSASASGTQPNDNVAVGFNSMNALTTGNCNVAVGSRALDVITTGSDNVGVGCNALGAATLGSDNVGLGSNALGSATTGTKNVAIGTDALDAVTTFSGSVAVGHNALTAFNGGTNTAVGYEALQSITYGTKNTAIGYKAMTSAGATNTIRNVSIGHESMGSVTYSRGSVAIGYKAMVHSTGGTSSEKSIAIGYWSMYYSNAGLAGHGDNHIAIGQSALIYGGAGANNIAIGQNASSGINGTGRTASDTVAIGQGTGRYVDSADLIAIGREAAKGAAGALATPEDVIAIGPQSFGITFTASADRNIAIGNKALYGTTDGSNNIAIGHEAGDVLTTGTDNTMIGHYVGGSLVSGTHNAFVGKNAGASYASNGAVSVGSGASSGNSAVAIGRISLTGIQGVSVGAYAKMQGIKNVAIGYKVGILGSGSAMAYNVCIGYYAAPILSTAIENVGIGARSFRNLTTGDCNTAVGNATGTTITTGSDNTVIGCSADVSASDASGAVVVGKNAEGATNSVSVGYSADSTAASSIAIGPNAQATAGNVVAIGSGATASDPDDIVIGQPQVSANTVAVATAWGQIFQDRSWDDGFLGFAKIDANGNIIKDNNLDIAGNLDMNCNNISNVASLFVGNIFEKSTGELITVNDPLVMASAADQIRFEDGIEIGDSLTNTSDTNAIAVGKNADVSIAGGIAVGHFANAAIGTYAIAIGGGASAGASADATSTDAIAIGRATDAGGSSSVAIGLSAEASGANSIAIGSSPDALASNTIAMGNFASAEAVYAISVGREATSKAFNSMALGKRSYVSSSAVYGLAIGSGFGPGSGAKVTAESAIAIGYVSDSSGISAIALGRNTTASANCAVAIGLDTSATAANVVAIGCGPSSAVADSVVFGSDNPVGSPTATVWGQIFQNKEWDDGFLGFAKIDANGNIIKDNEVDIAGNLDMNCNNISNVAVLEVSTIAPKQDTTTTSITAAEVTITGNLTVEGKSILKQQGYERRLIANSDSFTITSQDNIIACDTSANVINLVLPEISGIPCNQLVLHIVDEGGNASGNNITITGGGSDTVLGGLSIVLSGDYNSLALYADETSGWFAL